jgi:hypothetical protein
MKIYALHLIVDGGKGLVHMGDATFREMLGSLNGCTRSNAVTLKRPAPTNLVPGNFLIFFEPDPAVRPKAVVRTVYFFLTYPEQ